MAKKTEIRRNLLKKVNLQENLKASGKVQRKKAKKPFGIWLENFGKDVGGAVLGAVAVNAANLKPITENSEKGFSNLLGKYKYWIGGGVAMLILAIATGVFGTVSGMRKRKY